ncbi:MAG: shikimate kinase [Flavobacteriales bacterium]|nr:shikimate kinase [Flavobacteriales bacterium]|tara:strand:+ start:160 stop:651 length:492 start_codon:yes stop_codon:yes gene_type:complete
MKYFFIGFMGSGKSYIAKIFSKKYNLNHIDLDNYIEIKEKKTILEIFNQYGENYFRTLEKKYLEMIMSKKKDLAISTGGGTPMHHNLMDLMNNVGETIYLQCNHNTLFKRLKNQRDNRPLIKNLSDTELIQFIQHNLEIREQKYLQSKRQIKNDLEDNILEIL